MAGSLHVVLALLSHCYVQAVSGVLGSWEGCCIALPGLDWAGKGCPGDNVDDDRLMVVASSLIFFLCCHKCSSPLSPPPQILLFRLSSEFLRTVSLIFWLLFNLSYCLLKQTFTLLFDIADNIVLLSDLGQEPPQDQPVSDILLTPTIYTHHNNLWNIALRCIGSVISAMVCSNVINHQQQQ